MNTNQMYEILWNDDISSSYVMAIMPSNALRYVRADKSERCYIVNCNENSYLRGEVGHWMILTVHGAYDGDYDGDYDSRGSTRLSNDDCSLIEVFDSLGVRTYNMEMTAFITKFKHCATYSEYLSSTHCGYYVLVYAYYRSRKYKPSHVLNILSEITDLKRHCLSLYAMSNEYPS